jgi:hypothetical protein
MWPNSFFGKVNIKHLPWIKVEKNFGLLLYFSKNLHKENNRPIGENSPNLVTLFGTIGATGVRSIGWQKMCSAQMLSTHNFITSNLFSTFLQFHLLLSILIIKNFIAQMYLGSYVSRK